MSQAADFCAFEPLSEAIRWACLLEASAPKPGNVHPGASFADLKYSDFVLSANAVAPILAQTSESSVGRAVFEAVQATRKAVNSNTNLGIVLLLAPLAAVPSNIRLHDGIRDVLQRLSREDAKWVYRAIRLAQPGGLGASNEQDVAGEPTETLLDVMRLAADRDGVAAQYALNFDWVLREGLSHFRQSDEFAHCWESAIIRLQLKLMVDHPDTLIARKCGVEIAQESSRIAAQIVTDCPSGPLLGNHRLAEFDSWLRADSNRRNPGTTADLVTACLFAAIRDRVISPPEKI